MRNVGNYAKEIIKQVKPNKYNVIIYLIDGYFLALYLNIPFIVHIFSLQIFLNYFILNRQPSKM